MKVWVTNLLSLIKVELIKIKKLKTWRILMVSFLLMIILSILELKRLSDIGLDYITVYNMFFEKNATILLPLSIAIFSLSNTCNEFKNKSIKNLIMSKYSRTNIILSKYIAILISSILAYIITIVLYSFIAYLFSDKSQIYIRYEPINGVKLILHLIELNFMNLIYIASIVAFSFLLGVVIKKQGISILIFIVAFNFISIFIMALSYAGSTLGSTLFIKFSPSEFIGVNGYYFTKFIRLLPCISNIFLFLAISDFSFKKYQY